ncbi:MAG: protein-L-isoaspartate(D-aspartate) O-methyltransferase [Elusimicrobia bacterium]|nr:protein-L-isoaspartate(D-aspartate) O-methyltransferase [Candidatus Obscuribacterium magneticum]
MNLHKWAIMGLSFGSLFFQTSCNKSGVQPDIYLLQRRNMVRWDLKAKGIKSPRVLDAMATVPRHLFLPPEFTKDAYQDVDLPINPFLTTPRPFIVAKTIEALELKGNERVLEVGTGRGYESALLAELANDVYTIEIVPTMAQEAEKILKDLNYKNIYTRIGDGYQGWPEKQPFQAILVTASAPATPKPLLEQLAVGGRLVIPIGSAQKQDLMLYRKTRTEITKEVLMPVKLQPMEGKVTQTQKSW